MYKSLIKLLIPVVALSVMFCNEEVKKQISTEKHQVTKIDTVPIYHLKSSVGIPVSGSLSPWKESVLIAEDSSRIISLLVDDKSRVIAGDILLSLWNLKYRSEYTPLDIKAPFSGRVEKEVIAFILEKVGWNRSLAAKILKISYKALLYKINELEVQPPIKDEQPNHAY